MVLSEEDTCNQAHILVEVTASQRADVSVTDFRAFLGMKLHSQNFLLKVLITI